MAVAITQTANPAGVSSSGGVSTYTGVSTGTATPDRLIVVCIGMEVNQTVSSVTINDGSYTQTMDQIGAAVFSTTVRAYMYRASVPNGTTADVAVTFSGAVTNVQNHIAVYALTDAMAPPRASGTNTSTDMDVTAPLTTGSRVINGAEGVLAIAACANDATTKTWANITGDIDADAGDFRFQTAIRTTSGTVTMTCTGSTNGEDGALVWATFSNSQTNASPWQAWKQAPFVPGGVRR